MSHLSIEALQFSYQEKKVLNGLFLNVHPNEIYGFIGRNGAGKTTTLHCLLGYLTPQQGSMTFNGEDITRDRLRFKRQVGFVSDVPQFPSFLKAKEYLKVVGELYAVPHLNERIEAVLAQVDLKHVHQPIGAFSRGMRQRLAIGAAMLPRPKLLIMDEPTSALDPLGRDQVLELMQALKKETTILYSTHILDDAQRVSDRIGILEHGRLLAEGLLKPMLNDQGLSYEITFNNSLEDAWPDGQLTPESDTTYRVTFEHEGALTSFWSWVQTQDVIVTAFVPVNKTLTSLYYEVLDAHTH